MSARGLRRPSILGIALAGIVLGGCAGGDDSVETTTQASPDPGVVKVTMTEEGCEREGPSAVAYGKLTIEFVKDADGEGLLEVLRIADGATFEELVARIEGDSDRLAGGLATIGYQSLATLEAQLPLLADEEQTLLTPAPQDLEPGTHAMLCIGPDWLELEGPLSLTP